MADTEIHSVTHTGRIWLWSNGNAPASWHFLTIDGPAGEAIAAHALMHRLETGRGRGFGSVKVMARIGGSQWQTSVFPDSARGGYVLPLKAAIRKAERLAEGDAVQVMLDLV